MKCTLIVMLTLLAIGSACMMGGYWRYGNYGDPFDDYEFSSGPGWRSGIRAGVGVGPGLIGLGGISLLLSFLFANHHPPIHTVHHHHYYQEKPGGGYEYKHSSQSPPGGGTRPGYHHNENPRPEGFSNFFKNMFYK